MIGAIVGDIAGSRFEFNNYREKDFNLFGGETALKIRRRGFDHCCFTDDTVMTCAVAQALLDMDRIGMRHIPKEVARQVWANKFKEFLIRDMKALAKKYPSAGYGAKFYYWVLGSNCQPYNSFGNGSAMRVSPVIWFAEDLKDCADLAKWSAEVSHNHPEGIKGAVVTAVAGFMARKKASKEEIKKYVQEFYPDACTQTWQEIAGWNKHVETCMNALPIAMTAFYEGESYEDVIKTAIACGGDSDTIAAIAGAVAEAFYGVPKDIQDKGIHFLMPDLRKIVDAYYKEIILKRGTESICEKIK